MKEYAKSFYKSKRWQHTREAYAQSVGYLCERCLANGVIKPLEIVHHKIYITPQNINDATITLDFNNLEGVCRECHAQEHKDSYGVKGERSNKRYTVDEFGKVKAKI